MESKYSDGVPELGAIFTTTSTLRPGSIWAPSLKGVGAGERPVAELRLPSAFALREHRHSQRVTHVQWGDSIEVEMPLAKPHSGPQALSDMPLHVGQKNRQ